MARALTPQMKLAIEIKAAEVRFLASRSGELELDRLRDETAVLQALIAEARRLQRTGRPSLER